jgi:2-oxoglutarate ferredoxin oxidoreductase subunit alpha
LRLITVWPFAEEKIFSLAKMIKAFVVPEINTGQIVREVQRCAAGEARVIGVHRLGGDILEPRQVLNAIREASGRTVNSRNNSKSGSTTTRVKGGLNFRP